MLQDGKKTFTMPFCPDIGGSSPLWITIEEMCILSSILHQPRALERSTLHLRGQELQSFKCLEFGVLRVPGVVFITEDTELGRSDTVKCLAVVRSCGHSSEGKTILPINVAEVADVINTFT